MKRHDPEDNMSWENDESSMLIYIYIGKDTVRILTKTYMHQNKKKVNK